MSPLALRVSKERLLKPSLRTLVDRDGSGFLRQAEDFHCFEISAVLPVINDLAKQYPKYGAPDELMFLPASKTWLEFKDDYGRTSLLIVEQPDGSWRIWCVQYSDINGLFWAEECFWTARQARLLKPQPSWSQAGQRRIDSLNASVLRAAKWPQSPEWIRAALAMINTPRVIGRREHMPHAGHQRTLARAHGMVGKYPLHAWHELVLEVRPPRDESDRGTRETHLSGEKALHFCRAHLRIAFGKLILVAWHWRGNAELGIKQTRYGVKPPADGVWPAWVSKPERRPTP